MKISTMSLILSAFKCYRYMIRKGVQNELSFFNKSKIDLKRSYWPEILAPYLKFFIPFYCTPVTGMGQCGGFCQDYRISSRNLILTTWLGCCGEKRVGQGDCGDEMREDGRWKMEDERRKLEDGRWNMEYGRWKMRSRKMEGKDPQEGG